MRSPRPPARAAAPRARVGAKGGGRILLFNKPYGVVCQFSDHPTRPSLAAFIDLPGFYPAGRLDWDSEGLLVLTDDGRLQHRITHPLHKLRKVYLAQVEGTVSEAALERLRHGVELNDGAAAPAQAARAEPPAWLWQRVPPIRARKTVPTDWLTLILTEGRNRQVRRMTAAVGLPTLRLVRVRIGPWQVEGLAPGEHRLLAVEAGPQPSAGSCPSAR